MIKSHYLAELTINSNIQLAKSLYKSELTNDVFGLTNSKRKMVKSVVRDFTTRNKSAKNFSFRCFDTLGCSIGHDDLATL